MILWVLLCPGLASFSSNSPGLPSSVVAAVFLVTCLEGTSLPICINFNISVTFALALLIALTLVGDSLLLEAAWLINPWATPAALPVLVLTEGASFNREPTMLGFGIPTIALQAAGPAPFVFFLEAFRVTIIGAGLSIWVDCCCLIKLMVSGRCFEHYVHRC